MRNFLDKLGMVCSTVCGIHCLLLPFLITIIPYASISWAYGDLFEWGFLSFSLAIASFTLLQGFLVHKRMKPLIFASIGFILFIVTRMAGGHSHSIPVENGYQEYVIYGLAGILICLAHYTNHKLCHITRHCNCDSGH